MKSPSYSSNLPKIDYGTLATFPKTAQTCLLVLAQSIKCNWKGEK